MKATERENTLQVVVEVTSVSVKAATHFGEGVF